jgi:hypothetical protein
MPFITEINSLEQIPRFEVVKEPLFDTAGKRVGAYSIMRSDNRAHLGICKDKYRPVQMDEMLDIVNTATQRVGGITHNGFTFSREGRRVLIRSEVNEMFDFGGDKVKGMFYTIIDNTGANANKIIPSTTRIVCDNQLHLIKKQSRARGVAHLQSFDAKVGSMVNMIQNNIAIVANFRETVERLQGTKFSQDQMLQLLERIFPSKKTEDSTRLVNKRENIFNLFLKGKGNSGQSRWDALNAFTEFESSSKFTSEKFIRNLTLDNISNKALELLVN